MEKKLHSIASSFIMSNCIVLSEKNNNFGNAMNSFFTNGVVQSQKKSNENRKLNVII